MVYIISGVSGVGKSTIGLELANKLDLPFYDGDDFHSDANKSKMASGRPLADADRQPWLRELAEQIGIWNKSGGAVLACSALKEAYRSILSGSATDQVVYIFLLANYKVVNMRLNARTGHFMNAALLQSQFDTLEIPDYGIHIDASKTVEAIVKKIMDQLANKSEFGIIGLGVMGKSLARNIAQQGISLSVYNRQVPEKEVDVAKRFVESFPNLPLRGFDALESFVSSMASPRNILLMLPAGKAVDEMIGQLTPLLDSDDLIIDGGNSLYTDSIRRAAELEPHAIHFMGMGVSGGEKGALEGPSLMPGGELGNYSRIAETIHAIAAKDKNNKPCCSLIGPVGAGHFIKMIHNGIEYAEMQLLAEVYHFLRYHQAIGPEEIADLFSEWSQTELTSYLLEITATILRTTEGDAHVIDLILDKAGQKGTGGWSVNAALTLGKPLDTIASAVMARGLSSMKDERVRASTIYRNTNDRAKPFNKSKLQEAYQAARIINHAIGFDILREASQQLNWALNLSEIARVWTNGCIIRSNLMEQLVSVFQEFDAHVLLHPSIVDQLRESHSSLASLVSAAMKSGCAVQTLASANNYFLSFIAGQSPANLIQAQRDFFGAHQFQRVDDLSGRYYHFNWSGASTQSDRDI